MDVQVHEDDLITRLLLSTATSLRVLDDRANGELNEHALQVGILFKDGLAPVETGVRLTLREACNKVIHARDVELKRTKLSDFCAYLSPDVTLIGRDQRAKLWHATLNVIEYVQEAQIGTLTSRTRDQGRNR